MEILQGSLLRDGILVFLIEEEKISPAEAVDTCATGCSINTSFYLLCAVFDRGSLLIYHVYYLSHQERRLLFFHLDVHC